MGVGERVQARRRGVSAGRVAGMRCCGGDRLCGVRWICSKNTSSYESRPDMINQGCIDMLRRGSESNPRMLYTSHSPTYTQEAKLKRKLHVERVGPR